MKDSANQMGNTVLKCQITVTKDANGYNAKYVPEIIPVYEHNTDIHFHIDAKSSDDVEIDSVGISPLGQNQLIDPDIKPNRQQYNLKDLNTAKGTFILSFQYRDKHGNKLNVVRRLDDNNVESADVPKIENNPPG
ncbi:hypothetical protein [Pseudoduganella sp. OTU4001]|uniref:hypothetical protein n=1 Tax=Pseudoduganella sp. OTU4001 TaxID=3043854 RepID=UPI00313DF398